MFIKQFSTASASIAVYLVFFRISVKFTAISGFLSHPAKVEVLPLHCRKLPNLFQTYFPQKRIYGRVVDVLKLYLEFICVYFFSLFQVCVSKLNYCSLR